MNHFGAKNGFGLIQDAFEREDLDPVAMAAILRPLGNCAELLSQSAVCPMLTKCMDRAVSYVSSLEDKDLKNKVKILLFLSFKSFLSNFDIFV